MHFELQFMKRLTICFVFHLSDQVFKQTRELTSNMKTPLFISALFLFIISLTKAKHCEIQVKDILNGTVV